MLAPKRPVAGTLRADLVRLSLACRTNANGRAT